MGEDEGVGAGDTADLARAGGDVLKGAPALVEQGEARAFAEAAEGPLEGVVGAGAYIEFPAVSGCLTGMWMPIPAPP
jgi:hypothetical protein